MNKPTIFFSHSSKDKDMLVNFKERLNKATNRVLDIFLSSDGQSIPFGSNWIHKIEKGLDNAKIMFVFVTPNSIISNWIYFEAGFAYSKKISVVPVGVGIDIALLKPPLNLLQGFNIQSADSLNNFLNVVNNEFGYSFVESFTADDYTRIFLNFLEKKHPCELDQIFDNIFCDIPADYNDDDGISIHNNLDQIFSNILSYLNEAKFVFSYDEKYNSILVSGLKMQLQKDFNDKPIRISFTISPYNFNESFKLLNSLIVECHKSNDFVLRFKPKEEFSFVVEVEKISSILSNQTGLFKPKSNSNSVFIYKELSFSIYESRNNEKKVIQILAIKYKIEGTDLSKILNLIIVLLESKIIY